MQHSLNLSIISPSNSFIWIAIKIFICLENNDMLNLFNNISRVFTVKEITFFSLNLLTAHSDRSQAAHNVHTLIQSVVNEKATICLSLHADEIIYSFAGYGSAWLLSDWYSNEEIILERLDIANMTIVNKREYFYDLISIFVRRYYFPNSTHQPFMIYCR